MVGGLPCVRRATAIALLLLLLLLTCARSARAALDPAQGLGLLSGSVATTTTVTPSDCTHAPSSTVEGGTPTMRPKSHRTPSPSACVMVVYWSFTATLSATGGLGPPVNSTAERLMST